MEKNLPIFAGILYITHIFRYYFFNMQNYNGNSGAKGVFYLTGSFFWKLYGIILSIYRFKKSNKIK